MGRLPYFEGRRFLVLGSAMLIMLGPYAIYAQLTMTKSDVAKYLISIGVFNTPDQFEPWYNLMYSVYNLPNIILPLLMGLLTDTHGVQMTMYVLGTTMVIGHLLFIIGIARGNMYLALIGRFFFGGGTESLANAQTVVITRWSPSNMLGFFINVSSSIAGAGTVIGDVFSRPLIRKFGLETSMWMGLVLLVCCVGFAFVGASNNPTVRSEVLLDLDEDEIDAVLKLGDTEETKEKNESLKKSILSSSSLFGLNRHRKKVANEEEEYFELDEDEDDSYNVGDQHMNDDDSLLQGEEKCEPSDAPLSVSHRVALQEQANPLQTQVVAPQTTANSVGLFSTSFNILAPPPPQSSMPSLFSHRLPFITNNANNSSINNNNSNYNPPNLAQTTTISPLLSTSSSSSSSSSSPSFSSVGLSFSLSSQSIQLAQSATLPLFHQNNLNNPPNIHLTNNTSNLYSSENNPNPFVLPRAHSSNDIPSSFSSLFLSQNNKKNALQNRRNDENNNEKPPLLPQSASLFNINPIHHQHFPRRNRLDVLRSGSREVHGFEGRVNGRRRMSNSSSILTFNESQFNSVVDEQKNEKKLSTQQKEEIKKKLLDQKQRVPPSNDCISPTPSSTSLLAILQSGVRLTSGEILKVLLTEEQEKRQMWLARKKKSQEMLHKHFNKEETEGEESWADAKAKREQEEGKVRTNIVATALSHSSRSAKKHSLFASDNQSSYQQEIREEDRTAKLVNAALPPLYPKSCAAKSCNSRVSPRVNMCAENLNLGVSPCGSSEKSFLLSGKKSAYQSGSGFQPDEFSQKVEGDGCELTEHFDPMLRASSPLDGGSCANKEETDEEKLRSLAGDGEEDETHLFPLAPLSSSSPLQPPTRSSSVMMDSFKKSLSSFSPIFWITTLLLTIQSAATMGFDFLAVEIFGVTYEDHPLGKDGMLKEDAIEMGTHLQAILGTGCVILPPLLSLITDQYPRIWELIMSLALVLNGSQYLLLHFMTPTVAAWSLAFSFCLFQAVVWPCIAASVPEETQGLAYGITTVVSNIGSGVLPLLVTPIRTSFGFEKGLWYCQLMFGVLMIAGGGVALMAYFANEYVMYVERMIVIQQQQQQQQQQQIVEEVPIKDNTSVLNASLKTPLLPLQPQVSILRQELLQQYHNTLNNTDFDNNDYTGEVSNPLSDNNNINNKNFSPATLNSSSPLNWLPVLPRTPSNQQVIPQQQHSFASRSQLYFSSNSHQPQALFGIDNPPVHSLPNQRMSRSMFNITAANNNSFIHQNNNKSRSNSNNPLNNNNNSNKNSLESSSHRVVAPLPPFRFSPQENTAATFGLRRCNSGGHSVFGSLTARRIAAAGVLESKGVDENLMKTSVLFSRLMSSSAAGSRRGSWKDQAAASNLYFNTRNVQSSPFSVLELNNNNAVESSFVYQQQNGGELLESVHEE